MTDFIQHQLYLFASQNDLARNLMIFCAEALIFVVAAAWALVLLRYLPRITGSAIVRIAILMVLAAVLTKLSGYLITDTRPYLAEHFTPLAPVAHDNGFPSDHVVVAAVLTASLWWVKRGIVPVFAAVTLLIMVGRLSIGAHHTLDVIGSLVIAVVAALIAGVVPLPHGWNRPLRLTVRREAAR